MTGCSDEKEDSSVAQKSGNRVRGVPAGIRPRIEPDPVDVALGYGDSDASSVAARVTSSRQLRQATPATATATVARDGDTATATADSDITTRQSDTTTGDSDTATRRGATPRQTTVKPGVATDDSTAPTGDTTATAGRGDMTTATAAPVPRRRRRSQAAPAEGEDPGAEEMRSRSFSLPPSLIDRLRSAQWHTQLERDGHANLSELARRAIDREVTRLERKYNAGSPFPAIKSLPTGPSPQGAKRGAQIRARRRRSQDGAEGSNREGGDGA
ncbi:hypothetical protein ACIBBE_42915 [Streptomyces sp. NPDC051644]|uniref:ParB family protein n=1 Tax=Streptomyces sp. NPDC051644 TaxID=3365666 RepID=UPI0037B8AD0C